MSWFSRRICFLAGGLGLALAGSASFGATYSMKAVKINGTPLASPQSTINAMSGDRIEAEVFLRGWNEDEPGGKLSAFQFTIDGKNNFFKSEADNLNVALPGCFDLGPVVKCASNADCPVATPICGINMICVRPCVSDADCGGDLPVCELFGGFCSGVDHDPSACAFADISRSDWPLDHSSVIAACSFQGVDIACGAATLGAQGTDSGQTAYVGTVTIDLTASACGTIVPALATTEAVSFIALDSGNFVPATEDLTINVTDNPTCMGCSTLVSSTPPDCSVDARIPHAMTSTNPNFWFTDEFDFELEFNNMPEGGFMQSDFSLSVIPPQPILPSIDAFSVDASGKIVSFSVNRPPSLAPPRWLCINFDDPNPSCPNQPRCWARLPGDVNGDNTTSADDLTTLIQGVNLGGLELNRCDLDRSGACNAPDLLMWINLANGAGVFAPALGKALDPCPTLP